MFSSYITLTWVLMSDMQVCIDMGMIGFFKFFPCIWSISLEVYLHTQVSDMSLGHVHFMNNEESEQKKFSSLNNNEKFL